MMNNQCYLEISKKSVDVYQWIVHNQLITKRKYKHEA